MNLERSATNEQDETRKIIKRHTQDTHNICAIVERGLTSTRSPYSALHRRDVAKCCPSKIIILMINITKLLKLKYITIIFLNSKCRLCACTPTRFSEPNRGGVLLYILTNRRLTKKKIKIVIILLTIFKQPKE